MDGVRAQRWRRYGHDRVYVTTAGGENLGYWDVAARRPHPTDPAHRDAVTSAAAALLAEAAPTPAAPTATAPAATAPAATAPAAGALPPPAADLGWAVTLPAVRDMSRNAPGQAARQRAVQLRREAPVRTALARVLGVQTDERSWRIGADGEKAVAKVLSTLDERWRVLHAVEVGSRGSDIDHVVIGPGGVYTVNAKHHPDASVWVGGDTLLVNGFPQPYVRNSRHEARRAARLLGAAAGMPVRVTGIVAVMGARKGFTVKAQPSDAAVVVLTRRTVAQWLCRQPESLTDAQVERLHAVARRSTTWSG